MIGAIRQTLLRRLGIDGRGVNNSDFQRASSGAPQTIPLHTCRMIRQNRLVQPLKRLPQAVERAATRYAFTICMAATYSLRFRSLSVAVAHFRLVSFYPLHCCRSHL